MKLWTILLITLYIYCKSKKFELFISSFEEFIVYCFANNKFRGTYFVSIIEVKEIGYYMKGKVFHSVHRFAIHATVGWRKCKKIKFDKFFR